MTFDYGDKFYHATREEILEAIVEMINKEFELPQDKLDKCVSDLGLYDTLYDIYQDDLYDYFREYAE